MSTNPKSGLSHQVSEFSFNWVKLLDQNHGLNAIKAKIDPNRKAIAAISPCSNFN